MAISNDIYMESLNESSIIKAEDYSNDDLNIILTNLWNLKKK